MRIEWLALGLCLAATIAGAIERRRYRKRKSLPPPQRAAERDVYRL